MGEPQTNATQPAMLRRATTFALLSLALPVSALEVRVETLPSDLAAKTTSLNPDFLVLSTQQKKNSEGKPLVIYLHGAGGRGMDIAKKKPIPRFAHSLERLADEPAWVVAPQCLPGANEDKRIWQPNDLNILLDHLRGLLRFDPRRVYLTGYSMGGYGSWAWGASNPEHFAAIVPVAGGLGEGGPKDITPDLDRWAKALSTVPVWAWHGADDAVVPADRSERMIGLVRERGGSEAKLTILPGVRHDSHRTAFDDPEVVRWLLAQAKAE